MEATIITVKDSVARIKLKLVEGTTTFNMTFDVNFDSKPIVEKNGIDTKIVCWVPTVTKLPVAIREMLAWARLTDDWIPDQNTLEQIIEQALLEHLRPNRLRDQN